MYIIASGRVALSSRATGQEEQLNPGATFGQEALNYGSAADYTAVATGSVEAWRLHRREAKGDDWETLAEEKRMLLCLQGGLATGVVAASWSGGCCSDTTAVGAACAIVALGALANRFL